MTPPREARREATRQHPPRAFCFRATGCASTPMACSGGKESLNLSPSSSRCAYEPPVISGFRRWNCFSFHQERAHDAPMPSCPLLVAPSRPPRPATRHESPRTAGWTEGDRQTHQRIFNALRHSSLRLPLPLMLPGEHVRCVKPSRKKKRGGNFNTFLAPGTTNGKGATHSSRLGTVDGADLAEV